MPSASGGSTSASTLTVRLQALLLAVVTRVGLNAAWGVRPLWLAMALLVVALFACTAGGIAALTVRSQSRTTLLLQVPIFGSTVAAGVMDAGEWVPMGCRAVSPSFGAVHNRCGSDPAPGLPIWVVAVLLLFLVADVSNQRFLKSTGASIAHGVLSAAVASAFPPFLLIPAATAFDLVSWRPRRGTRLRGRDWSLLLLLAVAMGAAAPVALELIPALLVLGATAALGHARSLAERTILHARRCTDAARSPPEPWVTF